MTFAAPTFVPSKADAAAFAPIPFDAALRMERSMLSGISAPDQAASVPVPQIAVWTTHQALIVPSGMPRIANFESAADAMAAQGWPVLERDTGGDLTPQFDGMLNLSMTFTLRDNERNIAAAYGRLTQPIISFLNDEFGIESYASSIAGAFCDGAHNVAIDGRKLAGTAQRWRLMPQAPGQPSLTRVLGHIAVVCCGDLESALDAVNGFYRASKLDRKVVREAHISLQELIGRDAAKPQLLAERLSAYLARTKSHVTA
jgi:hypothetical protein